jgi:hypothetical protein
VNLAVGLSILLAFAASAVPAVVVERNRVPASVSDPRLVVDESELSVRCFVRDAGGTSMSVDGTAAVSLRLGRPGRIRPGEPEPPTVQRTFELRPARFRRVRVVYPQEDGSAVARDEVVLQLGPLDVSPLLSDLPRGRGSLGLGVAVRVEPSRGQPMEAGAKWFELTPELQSSLAPR